MKAKKRHKYDLAAKKLLLSVVRLLPSKHISRLKWPKEFFPLCIYMRFRLWHFFGVAISGSTHFLNLSLSTSNHLQQSKLALKLWLVELTGLSSEGETYKQQMFVNLRKMQTNVLSSYVDYTLRNTRLLHE